MTNSSALQIPPEFEQYRKTIEETFIPVIEIEATEGITTLFDSKFAGDPYFPCIMSYPTTEENQPLKLLAQINFADVPHHLPHFPTTGILQFFIDPFDDVLGLDFDNGQSQKGFRVIFHEHIIEDKAQLIQDFSFITNKLEDFYFPVEKEMALTFTANAEALSMNDFRTEKTYAPFYDDLLEDDDIADAFYDAYGGTGHKMGGYPFFTQTDPRAYGDYPDATILLLQVDSIGEHIMWGDVGVGNFFISEEALKRRDFSQVLYNWDCH